MKVSELVNELKKIDGNLDVIIDGEHIHGVIVQKGKYDKFFSKNLFRKNDKGTVEAVRFLMHEETSEGYWILAPV